MKTFNFYDLLKTHNILIYGKDYTPSMFSLESGAVWVKNEHLGYFMHEDFTGNKKAFNEHIKNMIDKGLSINIIARGF